MAQSLGAASSMLTATANTMPVLPASVGASSVGKHHRRLGSMGKTKRRLSDAREASVRPMYVSISFLFFACFLSLFLLFFFFVVLVHVAWPSVPVPSLCLLWIACPFFCPFFPCLFLRGHSRMSCVPLLFYVFLFASPPFPQTVFGYLTFV